MSTINKIIGFGDSVMKGIVTEGCDAIDGRARYSICSESFAERCKKVLGRNIINFSRFGSTIAGGQRYLQRHQNEIAPGDYVVMEFGGNDCNFNWKEIAEDNTKEHHPMTSVSEFKNIYSDMIDEIRNCGGSPVLLSLPPICSQRFFNCVSRGCNREKILEWLGGDVRIISDWHEQYNLEVFKLGLAKSVRVFDITSTFFRKKNYPDYLCEDGMHPNQAGHRIIAEAILEAI
ncbi:MAG: SGNH/GDSL hydrolase family protein [Bacteroidales bacterium]|nr:SGNH/GDSL hydrolase family protein [Bacteroidales bacterium]